MATRAQERPWARRQGSAPPPLPSHSVPSEGLSFPASAVPGLDVLPVEAPSSLVSQRPHPPVTCASGLPIMIPSQKPAPTLPDEEGAQDEDDETHDARCVPPLGLVALGACQDRPIVQVGQQGGVACPVWGGDHGHPQPTQARSVAREPRGWAQMDSQGTDRHTTNHSSPGDSTQQTKQQRQLQEQMGSSHLPEGLSLGMLGMSPSSLRVPSPGGRPGHLEPRPLLTGDVG